VRSYRTLSPLPVRLRVIGGLLSAALSVGFHRPAVSWHSALWCPDFPREETFTRLPVSLGAQILKDLIIKREKSLISPVNSRQAL